MAKNRIDGGNIFDLQNIQQTFERIASMFDNLKRKVDEISKNKITFSGDNGADLKNMATEINKLSTAVISLTKSENDLKQATKLKNEAEKITIQQAKEQASSAKSLDAQRQKAYQLLFKEEQKQKEQARILTELNAKYKAQNITIKELGQLWGLAKKQLDGYTTAQIKSSKEAQDLQKHVAKLGKEYDKLKQAQGVGSQNVGRYWESMKSGLVGVAGAFGLAVGGAQLLGSALTSGFDIIRQYGKEWSTLKALMGNATQKEQRDIINVNNELSKSLGANITEIIKLEQELSRAGFSAAGIAKATPGIVALATATGEDLQLSAEIIGANLNAFNMNADQTNRLAGVMARTFNETASGLRDFAESSKYAATDARLAGVSFEQMSSMLGILANNGIKGSMAGASLRKIFVKLKDETGTLEEKFNKLNVSGVGLDEALNEAGLTARTALQILVEKTPKVNEFATSLGDAAKNADILNKTVSVMTDNIDTDLKKAGTAWERMVLRLNTANEGLGAGIRTIIQTWTELLDLIGSNKAQTQIEKLTPGLEASIEIITGDKATSQQNKIDKLIARQADLETRNKLDQEKISKLTAEYEKAKKDGKLRLLGNEKQVFEGKRDELTTQITVRTAAVDAYRNAIKSVIGVAEIYDPSKTKLRDPAGNEETETERKARLSKDVKEKKSLKDQFDYDQSLKRIANEIAGIENIKNLEYRNKQVMDYDRLLAEEKLQFMIENSKTYTTFEIENQKLTLKKLRDAVIIDAKENQTKKQAEGANIGAESASNQPTKVSFLDKIMRSVFGDNTSDEKLSEMKSAFAKAGQIMLDGLNNLLNIRSAALDREISLREKNISDLQSKIETEKNLQDERKNKGEAYDNSKVKNLEKQIEIEKAARQKALNEQKKIANAQFAVDSAIQASNMITTFTSIVAAFAKGSPWGWLLGIAAGGVMLGTMIAQKKAINAQFKTQAREGDYRSFDGAPSHEQGGINTAHANVEAEGGEAQTIWTKRAIMKNGGHRNMAKITSLINKGVLFSDLTKYDNEKNTNVFVGGMSDERIVNLLQKSYDLNRSGVQRDGKITYDIHKNQTIKTA